ncbi:MAG: hypothetical protein V1831_04240 [Candidatus Woesearchaeota archaeon]
MVEIAKDEFYDLTPHSKIVNLKKEIEELKSKTASSDELLNSMESIAKSMDDMLKLFTQAAGDHSVEEKLDEIINQNKLIIDHLSPAPNRDFTQKPVGLNLPKPNFQPTQFQQSFNRPVPQEMDELPELKELEHPSRFEEPPMLPQQEPHLEPPRPTQRQGPVAMPSIPFQSFREFPKPGKKGLFGRLKK